MSRVLYLSVAVLMMLWVGYLTYSAYGIMSRVSYLLVVIMVLWVGYMLLAVMVSLLG